MSLIEFKNLHIVDVSVVQMKPQSCPDKMITLDSRSARIDNEHIPFGVPDHLKNVRMAANKYVRLISFYQREGRTVIPGRITTYMSHQHLHPFTLEKAVQRIVIPQVEIVAIA